MPGLPSTKPVAPVNEINPLCKAALQFAKTQLGIKEVPKNRGPHVRAYLGSVGLNEGYPWCAAFVYFCFSTVAYTLKKINPLIKTGGVLNHWNLTKGIKVMMPRAGDIFIMDHGAGLGHTGFVNTVDVAKKTFTTCEGNSDSGGSRTGGMVCSNTRLISSCKGFIRY